MSEEGQKRITLPGVTFRIFTCQDDATGEDEICLVVNEQDYYELEKRPQDRGRTVHEDMYLFMADGLKSHGYNTPPDCFYVTVDLPEDGSIINRPVQPRTLQ